MSDNSDSGDAQSVPDVITHSADVVQYCQNSIARHLSPLFVLIDAQFKLQFVSERNPYVSRSAGSASDNVLKNVAPELSVMLSNALSDFTAERSVYYLPTISVSLYGELTRNVQCVLLPAPDLEHIIICFIEKQDPVTDSSDEATIRGQIMREASDTLNAWVTENNALKQELEKAQLSVSTLKTQLERSEDEVAALKREKDFSELSQKLLGAGYFRYHAETSQLFWSAPMFSLFELDASVHNPTRDGWLKLINADDRQALRYALAQCKPGEEVNTTFRFDKEDGTEHYLWLSAQCRELVSERWLEGTVQDVTQLEKNRQEADFLKNRIDMLMNSTLIGIYVFDIRSQLNTYINSTYTHLTGYTKDDLNKLDNDAFMALFHPEDQLDIIQHMQNVISGEQGSVFSIIYRFRHKDGHWVTLQSSDTGFRFDENGKAIEFIGSFVLLPADPPHEKWQSLTH